jgi:hypothetical protein
MIHSQALELITPYLFDDDGQPKAQKTYFPGPPLMNIPGAEAGTDTAVSAPEYFTEKGCTVIPNTDDGPADLVIDIRGLDTVKNVWRYLKQVFEKGREGSTFIFLAAIPGHWPGLAETTLPPWFWEDFCSLAGYDLEAFYEVAAYNNRTTGLQHFVVITKTSKKFPTSKGFADLKKLIITNE